MEIKIGDTVDCSGWTGGKAVCKGGRVEMKGHQTGDFHVRGGWSDDADCHWVRPDQITRHVPAAPAVERTKSVGDKLASEMTVRERFMFDYMIYRSALDSTLERDIELTKQAADALIAALDKERT